MSSPCSTLRPFRLSPRAVLFDEVWCDSGRFPVRSRQRPESKDDALQRRTTPYNRRSCGRWEWRSARSDCISCSRRCTRGSDHSACHDERRAASGGIAFEWVRACDGGGCPDTQRGVNNAVKYTAPKTERAARGNAERPHSIPRPPSFSQSHPSLATLPHHAPFPQSRPP